MSPSALDTPELRETEASRLAKKIWARYELNPEMARIMIGIAGIPGSGKSTLAAQVTAGVNAIYTERKAGQFDAGNAFAVDLPMDGFHLSRAQLAAMPNAAEAIHRRGAAFTFDGEGFLQLVQRLREPLDAGSSIVYAPGFDHAVKDPVADEIPILPTSRVLIFEGNYLALDREPWRSAAGLMDELWFIDVDREVARERLVKRHVLTGVTADEASARHRIASTDFLNADDIMENRLPVQEIVRGDS